MRGRGERESGKGGGGRLGERKTGRGGRGRGKWPAGYEVSNVDGIVLPELAINSANDDKKRRAPERNSERFRRACGRHALENGRETAHARAAKSAAFDRATRQNTSSPSFESPAVVFQGYSRDFSDARNIFDEVAYPRNVSLSAEVGHFRAESRWSRERTKKPDSLSLDCMRNLLAVARERSSVSRLNA